jgi:hypothetical protein
MNSSNSSSSGLTTFEFIELFAAMLLDMVFPLPPMLWSLTGVGKSAVVRQTVERVSTPDKLWTPNPGCHPTGALEIINDWGLIDLRTSLMEPTDLRGLPDLKSNVVRWVVPDELPVVGEEDRFPKRGILFLDEFSHASPCMQSACFSLVLDRRCGPHVLLPGWHIVAASNYGHENAQSFALSEPLRTRFQHFHLRCSPDAFKQWALSHSIDPRIIAFLNWHPDYLHRRSDIADESFPTPRTWACASKALSRFPDEANENLIAASVGSGTATVFCGFLALSRSSDLNVDIGRLLSGKAKAPKLTTENPDVAWALTGRISAYVREHPELLSPAIKCFCGEAWKGAREIARTGLADLKWLADPKDFSEAFAPHTEICLKAFGRLLE